MKRFLITALLIGISTPALSVPARLGGFSYSKNKYGRPILDKKTETFNEGPAALKEDEAPARPFYLNEDGSDARFSVSPAGDKYKLIPVYSEKQLHETKSGSTEGEIEAEAEGFDNDDEEDEEDDDE